MLINSFTKCSRIEATLLWNMILFYSGIWHIVEVRKNDLHKFSQFWSSNAIGWKSNVLFVVLRWTERNDTNDLLDLALSTIPPTAIVDSGKSVLSPLSSREQRKAQTRSAKDAFGDSIGELQKAFRALQSSREQDQIDKLFELSSTHSEAHTKLILWERFCRPPELTPWPSV